jgi:hypothetical protein
MAFIDDTGTPDFNTAPEIPTPEPPKEPGEKNNKTFVMVAGGLGALILLSLIGLVVVFLNQPNRNKAKDAERAAIETQNAGMAMALTTTADAALWTPTSLPSPVPTETVQPTDTPVVAIVSESPTSAMSFNQIQTATMAALNTQVFLAQLTPTSTSAAALAGTAQAAGAGTPSATALPASGIGDQLGVSGMVVAAIALLAVILLARRLRTVPTR